MSESTKETFEHLREQINTAMARIHEQQELLTVNLARMTELQQQLNDQRVLVERLRARVTTKDDEMALERASWRRRERHLQGDIEAMKKTVRMARGSRAA